MDQELFNKLTDLRYKLRNEKTKRHNKNQFASTIVCNDEVLKAIVHLKPQRIDDFKNIRGIGDAFVSKYANSFLSVISEHTKSNCSYADANKKEIEILQKLSNKLVNINQKNRLLYSNHLTNKTAFDLMRLDNKKVKKIIETFLSEDNTKNFVIAKVSYDKNKNNKTFEDFKAIKTLYRAIETIKIEKGQKVLYLGYPYVEGRLFVEDFKIKAPLLLFPAKLEVINNEYRLSFDKSRDIIYNTTLILANNKFNHKNEIINNTIVEEISKYKYINNAVAFFSKYNVNINEWLSNELEEYYATNNLTFPTYEDNKLHLKGYCVLGAFPTFSNSIQKDFNEIIDNKVISNLVRNLFIGIDKINNKGNFQYDKNNLNVKENNNDVDEKKLFYINEMNSSQEKVLSKIEDKDAIVIQGPPGTGKSQTITSLVSQAVLQNKKVLIISEKKTALDVIYNRLDKIANFVLYIDDPGNKQSFYEQLLLLLDLDDELVISNDKIKEKAIEINKEVNKLNKLENVLNKKTKLKSSLRQLYQNSKKLDLTNQDVEKLFKEVNNKKSIYNRWSLDELIKFRNMFNKTQLSNNLLSYKKLMKYDMVYHNFKDEIKETDLYIPIKDFYEIPFFINLYNKCGFYVKLLLKSKNKDLIKKIKNLSIKLAGKRRKKLIKLIYEDINFFMNSIDSYPKYIQNKNIYDSLNLKEKVYFEYCYTLSKKLNIDFQTINEFYIDVVSTIEIQEYENKYSKVLVTTQRYQDIRLKIKELSSEKEKLTFDSLYNLLQAKIRSVFNDESKRLNELKRKCESKRKWSITKLVNEFSLELFNSVYVWLLTPIGVSEILPLKEDMFDLIIFDEASQMFIESAVPILYRGKKAIVAGDSKQLRPSKFGLGRIDSDNIDYDEYSGVLEEESLLDLAKHRYHEVMLNYHYRSKYEELIAFSNYAFYDGKLHVCPNPIKTTTKPIERIKVNGRWINRQNEVEADEVITLLKRIFKEREKGDTIGIITFNSNQKDLIMDKIEQECLINQKFNNFIMNEKLRSPRECLFVKNIENVQGDERDIIIFSIGYAPNEQNRVVRQFGWLNNAGGENRLNVAISRSKKKVYVVTSIEPFELEVEDLKNRGPKLLRNYLEYVKAVSVEDFNTAQKILNGLTNNIVESNVENEISGFESSVYQQLTEIGFNVDRQVGIGTHKINLAIKDNLTNKYLLGIELDTLGSKNINSTKEQDYHRQKYLEGNGWIIHRIWCSDWWRDSDLEINKVISIMNNIVENNV